MKEYLVKEKKNKKKKSNNVILLTAEEFYDYVDFILTTYVQLEAGESILEVDPKGKSTIMIDCVASKGGLFYVGIVQGNPKITEENINFELYEKGDEYGRVNFFGGSYSDERYIAGEGSSEKLVWAKMSLRKKERNFLLINFNCEKPPENFLIWAQGPCILNLTPKPIKLNDIGHLKLVFTEFIHTPHFQTFQIEGKIIKVGYKILSSGYGFFVVKNLTDFGIKIVIDALNSENIKMSKI